MKRYLYPISKSQLARNAGTKAAGLQLLIRSGYVVPRAFVCVWDAFESHAAGERGVAESLLSEIKAVLRPECTYAVRSSANLEDGAHSSFAGQFRSTLDVLGADEVLAAVLAIWSSARSSELDGYLKVSGIRPEMVRMAVILQEMIAPVYSGILFSRNPMTGMKETVIEAVPGSGENLQHAGTSPLRWLNRRGRWVERSKSDSLPEEILEELVRSANAMEDSYGSAVDIEWVYDGRTVHYVQMRGITALDLPIHSCRISREVLPGLIKPLVWSVNTSLINPVWTDILVRLSGDRSIQPTDLTKCFYSRAYFNMTPFGKVFERLGMPRDALELLIGLDDDVSGGRPSMGGMKPGRRALLRLPAFLHLVAELLFIEGRFLRFLRRMRKEYDAIACLAPSKLDVPDLQRTVARLVKLTGRTAYFNILVPLLAMMYTRTLIGRVRKAGLSDQDIDLAAEFADLEGLGPNIRMEKLHELQARQDVSSGEFQREFDKFLQDFGHFSESGNDFSSRPWRESPDLVLEMVRLMTPRPRRNSGLQRIETLRLPLPSRILIRFLLVRARRFAVHRDRISSLYTYGYGQFRRFYLAFGTRFVDEGILDEAEDVFFADRLEVDRIATDPLERTKDWKSVLAKRKADFEKDRTLQPPETIFGDTPPPVGLEIGETLRGVPTSRGVYTGPVRVIRTLSESGRLQEGDVLVIPFSDVGWTPLFARAGAVVAESGGLLSHSSIVAREYGIPAVVSVPLACLLEDGSSVTVDGFRGEIRKHDATVPVAKGGSA